ncbi:MAG TPA: SDR family NAD(P)-dependent oxidoreductase [Bryobacteraceae bacterium]|nr:SDR family NAD(P)-dependent oxidoreductase [Bryobacteraceae bacterium]
MNEHKLQGRTALITGASRGLGKAMALALAELGARLALVARDQEALNATAAEVHKLGAEAKVFVADVGNETQVSQLTKQVNAQLGSVDILINNAGVNIRKPITEFTLEEWNKVLDTNLTSVFLLCRAFVPGMKGHGYGRIVNLSSTMAHVSIAHRTAYSASKAAILGITKALALELAPDGITVVAISPGPFATEMNTPLMNNPEINRQFIAKIPVGRWGKVEEVGKLVAYVCSEEAGFITGTDILIDGGWCAQ